MGGGSCEAEGGAGQGGGGLSHCKMHCGEAQMDQWAAVRCRANSVLPHIKKHAHQRVLQYAVLGALNLKALYIQIYSIYNTVYIHNTQTLTLPVGCVCPCLHRRISQIDR